MVSLYCVLRIYERVVKRLVIPALLLRLGFYFAASGGFLLLSWRWLLGPEERLALVELAGKIRNRGGAGREPEPS